MATDLFDVETLDEAANRATISLRVRVQPGAGRSSVAGRYGDALAVRVAAPPVDGRANAQCLDLVADLLGVRKSQVDLASGQHARVKRVRVTDVDLGRTRELLAQELERAGSSTGSTARGAQSRQRR